MTFVVYLGVLTFSVFFAFLGFKLKEQIASKLAFLCSFLTILIIGGVRSTSVGVDNEYYADWYLNLDPSLGLEQNILVNIINYEPGFVTLNYFLSALGSDYIIVSFIFTLITWGLIFKALKANGVPIHWAAFFFITSGFLFFTFNGIRQAIAMSLIFYSIVFLVNKKYFQFLALIFCATMFHFSSIVLVVFVLIDKLKKQSRGLLLVIFLCTLLLSGEVFYTVVFKIASLMPFYGGYVYRILQENAGFSAGVLYQILLGLILIFYYKDSAKTRTTILIFNITIIGALLYNLFYQSAIIARFFIYFLYFQNLALAVIVQHLTRRKRFLEAIMLCVLFLTVFFYKIYSNESGCCPYKFVNF